MAFALGKQRHQDIGPGDLVAAGILHMQDRALHHALKAGGRLGVLAVIDGQRGKVFIDIFGQTRPQGVQIDIAGPHHLGGVRVVDQGEQQMLQGGVFMVTFAGEPDGPVQGLF